MFADECEIVRTWNTKDKSPDIFQYDLDKLTDLANTWSLELNFSKCKM